MKFLDVQILTSSTQDLMYKLSIVPGWNIELCIVCIAMKIYTVFLKHSSNQKYVGCLKNGGSKTIWGTL